jgi:hypothetical protein
MQTEMNVPYKNSRREVQNCLITKTVNAVTITQHAGSKKHLRGNTISFLSSCSIMPLTKMVVAQLVSNLSWRHPGFIEGLQELATGPYPETIYIFTSISSRSILILSSHVLLDLRNEFFLSHFSAKTMYAFPFYIFIFPPSRPPLYK